jgi:hypothetical protein
MEELAKGNVAVAIVMAGVIDRCFIRHRLGGLWHIQRIEPEHLGSLS